MIQEAKATSDGSSSSLVSVIIPHYNDLPGLRVCYGRLMKQTWPSDDFEIVIADNNSTCGIAAVQEVAPVARVVPAPIQGAGPARNAAVAASFGQILAFIDSDCIPDENWVAEGVAALRQYDFVGGQVITLPRDVHHPNRIEAFECVFNFNFRRYIEEVGFTGTGNMFVPREMFDHVGGFQMGVAEDMDWSFRARKLGYKLGYAERAVVGHPARQTWASLRDRWSRMEAEHYLLVRQQRFGTVIYLMKAACMPLSIILHAWKVLNASQLKTGRAKLGAIAILARLRLWRTGRMLRLAMLTTWKHEGAH